MLILAADTSGKQGSLALARLQGEQLNVLGLAPLEGGTFSAQLVPQIMTLLKRHGLAKADIDAFAVASGPGSFTGLRVGLAAVKALAEVLHKPIAAISLLETVARAANTSGRVLSALDAGRGEVYLAEYDVQPGCAVLVRELILRKEELPQAVAGGTLATPDSALGEIVRSRAGRVIPVPPQRADAIARLGCEKVRAGEVVSPEALDATYIRRSDAEIRKSPAPA